jgi:cis-3-alkyl-4-acyloxetan-2-one decarboxylase
VIVVDLLGFGDSPKPDWATYDARTQAQSLAKTLLGLGLTQRVVLVGHSMGSLVAVEFAKRYPALVKALVLCSPPLYNVDPRDDKRLLKILRIS